MPSSNLDNNQHPFYFWVDPVLLFHLQAPLVLLFLLHILAAEQGQGNAEEMVAKGSLQRLTQSTSGFGRTWKECQTHGRVSIPAWGLGQFGPDGAGRQRECTWEKGDHGALAQHLSGVGDWQGRPGHCGPVWQVKSGKARIINKGLLLMARTGLLWWNLSAQIGLALVAIHGALALDTSRDVGCQKLLWHFVLCRWENPVWARISTGGVELLAEIDYG